MASEKSEGNAHRSSHLHKPLPFSRSYSTLAAVCLLQGEKSRAYIYTYLHSPRIERKKKVAEKERERRMEKRFRSS